MRPGRIVLLLVLLAVLGGVLFLLGRSLDPSAVETATTEPGRAVGPGAAAARSTSEALQAAPAAEGERNASSEESRVQASRAPKDENFALDGARWIEGLLRYPDGAPADDTLYVWAVDLHGEQSVGRVFFGNAEDPTALLETIVGEGSTARWSRRRPEGDGSFRLPCPSDASLVQLLVDGRWLYLPEREQIDAGAAKRVTLEPKLGAWLRVRCTV